MGILQTAVSGYGGIGKRMGGIGLQVYLKSFIFLKERKQLWENVNIC